MNPDGILKVKSNPDFYSAPVYEPVQSVSCSGEKTFCKMMLFNNVHERKYEQLLEFFTSQG